MACECGGSCNCSSTLPKVLDKARACVACLETASYCTEVKVVTRVWDGGEIGKGTPTETVVVLEPRPRVRPSNPRFVAGPDGTVATGTRLVSGVSLTYAESDLDDSALPKGTERYYLLNDKPYRLSTEVICHGTSWRFSLARMKARP